jgi:hypothetical protein
MNGPQAKLSIVKIGQFHTHTFDFGKNKEGNRSIARTRPFKDSVVLEEISGHWFFIGCLFDDISHVVFFPSKCAHTRNDDEEFKPLRISSQHEEIFQKS